MVKKTRQIKRRSPAAYALAIKSGSSQGRHHTREHDVSKGRSRKKKHKCEHIEETPLQKLIENVG